MTCCDMVAHVIAYQASESSLVATTDNVLFCNIDFVAWSVSCARLHFIA